MIEIRIRHEDEAKAVHLMEWPADTLSTVLHEVGTLGIRSDYGDHTEDDLSGQIVVEDGEAFYEIVISGAWEPGDTEGVVSGD